MSTKKKTAALSPGLVAVKGQAGVDPNAPARHLENEPAGVPSKASSPLNFKVDEVFRRRFRLRAAEADLKLNELLRQSLDAWEEKQGIKTE
ncbi:hypothetical protein [Desulfovibrio sp. DV]|uniref:ribbon-helix-helix protein n=1 Tax=Desulfovibrio sp. DV TaxID=1844708 RepID=UPI00094B8EA9|nr:hypothetical protein [Desulfovibrio sp. DV]